MLERLGYEREATGDSRKMKTVFGDKMKERFFLAKEVSAKVSAVVVVYLSVYTRVIILTKHG